MDRNDRVYEDFLPPHSMVREPAAHTLSVDLCAGGYKKEHIRVQVVRSHRRLIVRGERPVAGNRWSRFCHEVRLPNGCDTKGIQARFENGVVRVTIPRLAPVPVAVNAGAQQEPTAAAVASGVEDWKDGAAQQDGDRAARAGGGEEKEETVQRQDAGQRASYTKDGGRESAGVGGEVTAASPSHRGYGFVQDRRQMATTMLGVVLVLISLGIYVKYSLWP
ncbi:inactive protein RESTRICTED TEV MOVEMENT 2-like [Phragmites australis]|uniref:inactive protein RESTRICTED TEV MOVEMENT 2-like n=1 Tax=Phragmites australis TaxID=29695 RepID=UPI002D76D705|nr:inactive protein RESTRICTED TEV MOVEMENT 2-like [Phragmites australis]